MTDLLERAKASLVGVTQGPWEARRAKPLHDAHTTLWHVVGPEKAHICGTGRLEDAPKADAEFIASARDLVPELIAEVERLRASADTVERLQKLVDEAREDGWQEGAASVRAVVERRLGPLGSK